MIRETDGWLPSHMHCRDITSHLKAKMTLFRKKSIESALAMGKRRALKKVLRPVDLILMGVGAIVGTGIFILTGTGALTAGPAMTVSFLIAAIACGFAALCYAEFASLLPVTGSIYTYSYVTLGEIVAWVIGWDLMLEYGLATSAVSVGWSSYGQSLLGSFGVRLPVELSAAPGSLPGVQTWMNLPALLVMLAISWLVASGVRESTRTNNIMVTIKIGVVLLFIVTSARHVNPANWHPFAPFGITGIFNAAALAFFAFIGFDAVASAAEEVRDPRTALPIGLIGSLSICAVLYISVAGLMTGIVPFGRFAGVDHPVSLALQYVGETWMAGFVDAGAMMGMTTVILVMAYGQTRILFAMAEDGLLPAWLRGIHPRYGTPYRITWVAGVIFAILAACVPLNVLAELINIGTLMAFSLVSIAIMVLRKTHPDLPRQFKCPGMPVVPILSVGCCGFLLYHLSKQTWIAFVIWISAGLVVYFGYSRRNALISGRD